MIDRVFDTLEHVARRVIGTSAPNVHEEAASLRARLYRLTEDRNQALIVARKLAIIIRNPGDGSDEWYAYRDGMLKKLDDLTARVESYDDFGLG